MKDSAVSGSAALMSIGGEKLKKGGLNNVKTIYTHLEIYNMRVKSITFVSLPINIDAPLLRTPSIITSA